MFRIQKLNTLSTKGLERLPRETYEYASDIPDPDAIIVRSADMNNLFIPESVKAVARAGTGVNNIPIPALTERGIIVMNTPGANAVAVKELTIAGMLFASRNLYDGITWAKSLAGRGSDVPGLIEKGKSGFTGPEIKGKKLAVIGLGAIGVMVANDALALGMQVEGFDPFISVNAAWGLDSRVKRAAGLDNLLAQSDYVTLHMPLNDDTKNTLNKQRLSLIKKGAIVLNFARGGLVNNQDIIEALNEGIVSNYVTDFPDDTLLNTKGVIPLPHLGASTPEAEENCAVMAVEQTKEFLEKGNILNSVNYPDCYMNFNSKARLLIANRNVPKILGQVTHVISESNTNISEMVNRHKGEYAYNIIDLDSEPDDDLVKEISDIDGVIMTRKITA